MNLDATRDVQEILPHTTLWSGFEKLLNPMIPVLVDRQYTTLLDLDVRCSPFLYRVEEPTPFSALNALVSSNSMLSDVLKSVTVHLLGRALELNPSPTGSLHRLLSSLQQRHPDILQDSSRQAIDDDADKQEAVQQLFLSLSVVI
jgi:hypothetical protein